MIKRLYRVLIIFLLAFLFLIFTAVPALAFETRGGIDVSVGSGEVIQGDLYITGTSINIDGTVNGDVFGLGQTININGTVNGGITLAAQTITINGKVSSGARIAGQNITIGGSIGRDLIAACPNLVINNSATIGGDLVAYASSCTQNGHVIGNVTGSINEMIINGRIDNSVNIDVNTLSINSTGSIGGNLTYTSKNAANIQDGATITGTTNHLIPSEQPARSFISGIVGSILLKVFGFLSIFIIGLIFIFVMTRKTKLLTLALRDHPVPCLGWGALIFFVTPIAATIVMFTVIGIPLGLISLVIWGILIYLSQIPVALVIGWLILFRKHDVNSRGLLVGALALGLLILYLITSIPVVGPFIWLFVFMFGLGTLVTVFRSGPKVVVPPGPGTVRR